MKVQQKITPFLSFEHQAEEAANFYVATLPDSRIVKTMKNPATGGVISVEFDLAGMRFVALNVGQRWGFTDGISLHIGCESQTEINELWNKLTSGGGRESKCGWLKDRFGVSWQVVPDVLHEMLGDADAARAGRVMEAMLQMVKFDIAGLERAYSGA